MTRGLLGTLPGLLAGMILAMLASACGTASGEVPQAGVEIPASTPAFPLDEAHYSRHVNAVEAVDGQASFSDIGAPGFSNHPTVAGTAVLASSTEVPTAWAVYRFPLNNPLDLESVKINLFQGKLDDSYYVMLADYSSMRWQMIGQKTGTSQLVPADWTGMDPESPGNWCYIAILVVDNRDINIAGIEATIDDGSGTEYPIFDDFEDNDTLVDCTPIDVGSYLASTHDTYVPEMVEIDEGFDRWDFYCVGLLAGEHFTATMAYEFVDHFNQPNGNFNDLDVLVYEPGVLQDPLDNFSEQWSSLRIYFTNMEHVHFVAPITGTYRLGIRGDLADQFGSDSNAEYVLNVFKNTSTQTVSGVISQNGTEVDKKFLVVLTPGNFSAVTSLEASPHGEFTIPGVPSGNYTMSVHGSAAWGQHDYVYPNTKEVVVNGTNVTANLDIDSFPGS